MSYCAIIFKGVYLAGQLHVHMKEDDDQKSERKSARSFALLKRIALNIVRTKDTTPKRSLKRKLKHSGWDDSYLLNMLS